MQYAAAVVAATLMFVDAGGNQLSEHHKIKAMQAESTRVRKVYGRPSQILDEKLCVIAQRHANWMARTGRFEHSGEATGTHSGEQIIAWGQDSAYRAFYGWLSSRGADGRSGHYRWVVGTEKRCGFGCQKGHDGRWLWVGVYR
ncbi:MAG: CAP domain-containing protein [Planctomycetaceae bacterium]|jgi:hypothetical protein|nr:CAP domain-containing protein [Planctomycetaceae bacterium]MBT6157757.1 CAP domain-containing protein [Planctomycetaceae bacterium]MBT6484810.1 CAP domain-containing protein [Planctomycetaceae bacterium]MBT6497642.1 CAP domain-containing protein [Planctomycetaceae bacterium]